jgi:hypothetical protein
MEVRNINGLSNRPLNATQQGCEVAQGSAVIKLLSIAKLWALVCVLLACLPGPSQQKKSDDLFTGTTFKDVDLNGIRLRVGDPVEVTSQLGWHISGLKWDRWTFVHLTPFLARFPNGDLLATYAMDPDTQQNPQFSSAYQISHDGGRTWGMRYTTLIQHIPMIFIPAPNNSLIALPSEVMGTGPQPDRNFTGPLLAFERGGERVVMQENGFRVVDWPEPVDAVSNPQPKDNWHRTIHFTGSYLKVGSELLATVYWHPHGAKFLQLSLASSKDGGHTWRYYSSVATPEAALPPEGEYTRKPEGPDESTMIRLADGRLMIVFRVGEMTAWHVRRAFSSDNGRTWTKPDVLPAYSVEPQLQRLANGSIALSTGRPGLHLWLTTDPKAAADSWQDVDIAALHNLLVSDPAQHVTPLHADRPEGGWRTTAYTGLIQVAPNKLLLLYDCDPEGTPSGPQDLSRLFVMPIDVVKK